MGKRKRAVEVMEADSPPQLLQLLQEKLVSNIQLFFANVRPISFRRAA